MSKLIILLDFDGVLFNSAFEAYKVCEKVSESNLNLRKGISFDEFMSFRSHLTDAWQFNRLYNKDKLCENFSDLNKLEIEESDMRFTEEFFNARKEMMKDPSWPNLMSPYDFFFEVRSLLKEYSKFFKILSTRNIESISRTLEFYESPNIQIYGQEHIRKYGSKRQVVENEGWRNESDFLIYIDDMHSHLSPFNGFTDMNIHAGWGYDISTSESYNQSQAFHVIENFLKLALGKKNG